MNSSVRSIKIIFACVAVWASVLSILAIMGVFYNLKSPSQIPVVTQVTSPYITDFYHQPPTKDVLKYGDYADQDIQLGNFKDLKYGVECQILKDSWDGNGDISCLRTLTSSANPKDWLQFPFIFPDHTVRTKLFIDRIVKDNEICYMAHSVNLKSISCIVNKN